MAVIKTHRTILLALILILIAQTNFAQKVNIIGVFRMVNATYPTSTYIYFDFKHDSTFIYKEVIYSRLTKQEAITSKTGRWLLSADKVMIDFIDPSPVSSSTQEILIFFIKNSNLIYTYQLSSGKFPRYNAGQLRRLPEKFMQEYFDLLSR